MKRIICILLLLCLCLAGCGSGQPEKVTEPETIPERQIQTEPVPVITEAPETLPPETLPADPVMELMQTMTVEEMVGQLFLARCPESNAARDAAELHLGGYILFGRDFAHQDPDSFCSTIRSYQDAARIPMLIAVDEEGGTVCRVSSVPAFRAEKFRSPRSLYDEGGMELLLHTETEKAILLSSLGINVNISPVVDITQSSGAFMYSRSLGQSPEITGEFAAGAITRMAECSVGAVMKHFPGYGNNADTHTGIAVDDRSLEELENRDLLPYLTGIQAGGQAILMSHTIVKAFDSVLPASLSPNVHGYLRTAMGFDGVIVTDDLAMGAITEQYGAGESAIMAVLAGNDLLCSSEYRAQYEAVLNAVREGRIPMERVEAGVERILRWKHSLYLI